MHQIDEGSAHESRRGRGRPPATTAGTIATTALRLFADRGFDATTMDDIAHAVGVARRTLFSYYRTKNAIVWDGQEEASAAVAAALGEIPLDVEWRSALARTLPDALRYPDDDLDLLRRRLLLIGGTPSLLAHLVAQQDADLAAITRFIATRHPTNEDDLVPNVMARAVLSSLSASLVWWAGSTEPEPRPVVTRALRAVLLP